MNSSDPEQQTWRIMPEEFRELYKVFAASGGSAAGAEKLFDSCAETLSLVVRDTADQRAELLAQFLQTIPTLKTKTLEEGKRYFEGYCASYFDILVQGLVPIFPSFPGESAKAALMMFDAYLEGFREVALHTLRQYMRVLPENQQEELLIGVRLVLAGHQIRASRAAHRRVEQISCLSGVEPTVGYASTLSMAERRALLAAFKAREYERWPECPRITLQSVSAAMRYKDRTALSAWYGGSADPKKISPGVATEIEKFLREGHINKSAKKRG